MAVIPPIEIDVEGVCALRAAGEPLYLVDCREPDEHAIASIPGAVLIPLGQLPDRLAEITPHAAGHVVVHCHHGGRSLRAARFLRERGIATAQSMAGGIDAWAQRIDPATPRY